jgi:hypothetical protein
MRWVYFLCILFVIMAVSLSLISCAGFNFTCNDFSSELTLEENAKNLKECSKNQLQWKKTF